MAGSLGGTAMRIRLRSFMSCNTSALALSALKPAAMINVLPSSLVNLFQWLGFLFVL